MIQELLEYSRIGHAETGADQIDLAELIDDIPRTLCANDERQVVMTTRMPSLWVAPGMIRQIFQNLISNGLHYNESAPRRVEISAMLIGGRPARWVFAVRDNGIGIEPEYHAKIFEIFKRLHADQAYSGSGIGLASVRKAVTYLGDSVCLESTPGKGKYLLRRTARALQPTHAAKPALHGMKMTTTPPSGIALAKSWHNPRTV